MKNKDRISNKRIFITGGCGFIGSHLVKRCIQLGAHVGVLAYPKDSCWRLKEVRSKIKIFETSIMEGGKLVILIQKFRPQLVFHLAALLRRERSFKLIEELQRVHVEGTWHVLNALVENADLNRFIHMGTSEEYGNGKAPFREDQREIPVSPYSLTKIIATKMVEYLAREGALPAVIVRPSLIYGPAQNFGMLIPDIIRACIEKKDFPMTSGNQTKDFLFVDDFIEGLLLAAQTPGIDGEIINLGSGKETPVREVAAMAIETLRNPIKIRLGAIPHRKGEGMHSWLDVSKTKRMLGWEGRTDLKEGLKRTSAWYKANWDKIQRQVF